MRWWVLLLGLAARAQVKTDMGVYPLPALPTFGAAGSKVVDPTFGTTILRLTDGAQGNTQCTVTYSNIAAFNADSTWVVTRCAPNSVAVLFQIDPVTFTSLQRRTLSSAPSGLYQYWSIWSGINPNVLYVPSASAVYAYDVAAQTFSVSTQASSVLGSGETFDWQMSRSADDKIFANKFLINGSDGGYLAWRIESTGAKTVLLKVTITGTNEVQIDKSGRFLSVVMDTNGPDNSIWDLSTTPPTELKTTHGFRHYDSGHGTLFTSYEPRSLGFRSLLAPNTLVKMLPDDAWSYLNQQDHFSMQADNELWALASRYRIGTSTASYPGCVNNICPFDDELTQVATDGSQRVRRLAHHRSLMPPGGYLEAPMANMSKNGALIAFTSNWGNVSGRLDAYLLQVPPAPWPADTVAPSFPLNLVVQ
ncbi:MAG: hypothetical protein K1X64_07340 [Myxococcaceae bacterium]|nr:hypothetical protein [Myxococcaceae bacterium]